MLYSVHCAYTAQLQVSILFDKHNEKGLSHIEIAGDQKNLNTRFLVSTYTIYSVERGIIRLLLLFMLRENAFLLENKY